jgi:hypothetical protein
MQRTLLATLALVHTSLAWSAIDIGWIDRIQGNVANIQIIREGKRIDAAHYLPIQKGDQISVSHAGTKVVLALANGQQLMVDSNHPRTALPSGEVPSVVSNLLDWMVSLSGEGAKRPKIVVASTRNSGASGRLAIPMIKDETTLVSGERDLALAWQGGTPPYEVKLVRRDDRRVALEVSGLDTPQLVRNIHIAPGIHELIVGDATGATWREKLIAVSEISLPEVPRAFASLPPNLSQTLGVAWLAGVDDGKWILEAYTRVATTPSLDETSKALMRALEAGEAPEIRP